jgi:hypothetical protein
LEVDPNQQANREKKVELIDLLTPTVHQSRTSQPKTDHVDHDHDHLID